MVSWTTPNHKQRFSFCLSSWCPEKVFLFWAGFGRDHFEINSCKLTFPNIPSFQGRARVFRRSREKEPMQSSRSFLGVWLWPRSSAAAQAWSRLEDPFWPGSPWLSLPSWPCCCVKLGIWTKGDTAVNQIAGLFSMRTFYACPLGVPLPRRLRRTWPSHLLPLPSPMAAKGNPQSLFSNLKADSCILQNLFLKELLSHAEFQDAFCPLFTCCSKCRFCPSDAFLCFLCVTGSIVYLGMMVGAFFWGGLADKVGRKQSLLICMSINGFFAFLSSFVQGYGFFLFCRLLSGFG